MSSFITRHLGPTAQDVQTMLDTVGYASIEDLVDAAVPEDIRITEPLNLPAPLSEEQAQDRLREMAGKNQVKTQMIGQGFYNTFTPAVIRRNVVENPTWYTAYTPYQAEISQGRLEALLNFQTMVMDLTGLELANASLLDEASAAAEAMLMMRRANRKKSKGIILVDENIFPQTLSVVTSRATMVDLEIDVRDLSNPDNVTDNLPEEGLCGIILQQPGNNGGIRDQSEVIATAKEAGGFVTVIADLLALTLITPPGAQGADIAVGNTQRFGVPLFYGGPHAAYMAARAGLERSLPGRLVGVSTDDAGTPAYRLALQTREQHIRRDRATSNICTAQALLAVTASMYAVYHGPAGLRKIASDVHAKARLLGEALTSAGLNLATTSYFDTLVVDTGSEAQAEQVISQALDADINLRHVDATRVGVSVDETTTIAHLEAVAKAFGAELPASATRELDEVSYEIADVVDSSLVRTSDYLTHPTFNTIHSETQMMRYLRSLADKDLALDRTMIPLGSCTMKLNAATEMESITWPEFASIHPYVPADQAAGWRELIAELEDWLAEITGYAAVSVQPNAGSQGEYAGLMAIRNYHIAQGDQQRRLCLIPASAHGTNAASAVLAGLTVKVVKTAPDGSIDMEDLDSILEKSGDQVAAIMITYPSTHGVYETQVRAVCAKIHDAGGQVYLDGANLNALMGLAKPGQFGGDVSHLNLHKTFCIPHGGGGPGVGPIGVGEHLVDFLPGDPLADDGAHDLTARGGNPVVATIFGSAGVLPISWAYIAMTGAEGLKASSQTAILNANYLARRIHEDFPILFTGDNNLVAHECIIDVRELTKDSGITVEDLAKRLIDFGIHAPTQAFPVPGTLMIEPTESESLDEIERFLAAMHAMREEIQEVIDGKVAAEDSVLRRAPHTQDAVISSSWDRAYPVEQAAFPVPELRRGKYFSPVGRIDGAAGDRNLVCSCPPIEAFEVSGDDQQQGE
ncbi:aminomethyl-transferring glycine dehydrogenase [Auritidibacter ignavus]|uniref:Glycine dehydrogenase (decarboxylating) n=1 Tax=Auritidibacter ignavus TaxID=678932 RepID=A0AAJ6ANW5_9MICC|nr:aminomethyl-transferring glycine dehydrogenase [Auritidibacter ignavus]WGH93174.1 aminomethyl-transferring glycine dehydrogenase [Auritidibacter ignavus]